MTIHPRNIIGLALVASVAACTTPPAPSTVTSVVNAVTTLGAVAVANNTTAASLLTKGQSICKTAGGYVALLNALTSPATVVGQAANDVALACAAIGGIPTPAPAGVAPESIPAQVAPVATLPTIKAS